MVEIFYTTNDPVTAATWLDDKTAKNSSVLVGNILSNTIRQLNEPKENWLYPKLKRKLTPEIQDWCNLSVQSTAYTIRYGVVLAKRNEDTRLEEFLEKAALWFRDNGQRFKNPGFISFPNIAKEGEYDFTYLNDIPASYRYLLRATNKLRGGIPTWNTGIRPDWF